MQVRHRRGAQVAVVVAAVAAMLVGAAAAASLGLSDAALAGWPRQIGTAANDPISGVATSDDGDVYVVGRTTGAFPGATEVGDGDVYLARFDRLGRLRWVRQFGTTSLDSSAGVAVSDAGIFVAGTTSGTFAGNTSTGASDGFVARFDSSGNQRWLRQFGTTDDESVDAIAADDHGVYLSGDTFGAFPGATNQGSLDAFLIRFDLSGTQSWVRQFGTDGYELGAGVAVSSRAVYVTGDTSGVFPGATPTGDLDNFVARFDRSGNQRWIRQFGTTDHDSMRAIATSDDGIFLAGYTMGAFPGFTNQGAADGFVTRFDSGGNQRWVQQLGTDAIDEFEAVAAGRGGVYVGGDTLGTFPGLFRQGSYDGVVARFGIDGSLRWIREFGTSSRDAVNGLALREDNDAGGAVVTAGDTYGAVWGQIEFGGVVDGFVATFLS